MYTNNKVSSRYIELHIVKICVFISLLYQAILRYVIVEYDLFMTLLFIPIIISLTFYIYSRRISLAWFFKLDTTLLWVVFYLYVFVVTVIFSEDISMQISVWFTIFKYFLLFLCVYITCLLSSDYNWFVFQIWIISLAQVVLLLWKGINIGNGRVTYSYALNTNTLGMWLSFGLWCSLYLLSQKKIPRLPMGISVLLLLYGITKTGSKKAFIAAAICIIFWIVLVCIKFRSNKKNILRIFIIIIILIQLLVIFIPYLTSSVVWERLLNLSNDESTLIRKGFYENGFKMFLESPILGNGIAYFQNLQGTYSHSTLVEIPVSSGIIGSLLYFIPYLTAFVTIIKASFKKQMQTQGENNRRLLLINMIAVYFYMTCIVQPFDVVFMAILGMLFAAIRIETEDYKLISIYSKEEGLYEYNCKKS